MEVAYLVNAMQLRPSAITSYRRVAFTGNQYESGVRITFDMSLSGRVDDLSLQHPGTNHPLMSQNYCVLEVKSDDKVPSWVLSLLARHGCQTQRMSKYCAAVAELSGLHVPAVLSGAIGFKDTEHLTLAKEGRDGRLDTAASTHR
jgi:hypothetical protein